MGSGGDNTAMASEQDTAAFQKQLMTVFSAQYAKQSQLMSFVTPHLEGMVTKPQGLSPEALAATRTAATDVVAQQTQAAEKAAGGAIAAHGGAALPSGVAAQVEGGIAAGGAQQTAAEQNKITQENEQLKLQNYWKGISGLSGQAELAAPAPYASSAISAGNAVAGLSGAYESSRLAGQEILGGDISAAGSLVSGMAGLCWVAASFWGWDNIKTTTVRTWVMLDSPSWFRKFYAKHGEWISNTPLRWAFRPLFELILIREN